MGTKDWVLKGTKLITNTKAKIKNLEQRLDSQKYNIKEKKVTKIITYMYEVCFKKIGSFFCKVIVGYKHEN